jgi:pimeloyl-ACP methyl ester carboxylesterase
MKRRMRARLALLAGGSASYVGGSWLLARALSDRLISPQGLAPCTARREDLIRALRDAGYQVSDDRHAASERAPAQLATIFAASGEASSRPTILFVHGKGGSAAEWTPDALRALGLGYNVLLPDLRGHGASAGTFFTFGFLEKDDLAFALENARTRHGVDTQRLGIHSCSAGSSVAIELAATRQCRALWLESPFAEPREMARHYLAVSTGLPDWLLRLTSRWAVARAVRRVRRELGIPPTGAGLEQFDPVRSMRRVRSRICLVYGEKDGLVPPRFARRLEAVLPPGSQVWRIDGAGHCHHDDEAEKVVKEEYVRRWTAFFGENLPMSDKL